MAEKGPAPEAAPPADPAPPKEGDGEKPAEAKGLLASPIVRIGIFVGLLGVMGAASFLIIQNVIRPKLAHEEPEEKVEAPEIAEPGDLYVVETIIVNPAGTRASRFLRVGAALEYPATEAAVGLELEKRQHQLRDLFITEFSSRTLDELVDSRVKEEIREQLLAKLNTSVTSGHVTNLYFTEYVIQ